MSDGAQTNPSLDRTEHIDENISAKRVGNYGWDGSNWARIPAAQVPAHDYIDIQQTSSTVETYVFKTGGSGGTTVKTIVVTYTDSSKTDLDTVEYV